MPQVPQLPCNLTCCWKSFPTQLLEAIMASNSKAWTCLIWMLHRIYNKQIHYSFLLVCKIAQRFWWRISASGPKKSRHRAWILRSVIPNRRIILIETGDHLNLFENMHCGNTSYLLKSHTSGNFKSARFSERSQCFQPATRSHCLLPYLRFWTQKKGIG